VLECHERIPDEATADSAPLPPVDLSPLWTYYISRKRCAQDGINLGGGDGSIVTEAMLALKDRGYCKWELWPNTQQLEQAYSDRVGPPTPECLSQAAKHLVTDAAIIDSWEKFLTLQGLGYPISFGVPIYESLMQTREDGSFDLLRGQVVGGHCMRALGYSKSGNWIKIGNSWPQWGAKSSDPIYSNMNGYTNIGHCPLDDFQRYFSSRSLQSGETEAIVVSKTQKFNADLKPLISSYAEFFT